MDGAVLDSEPQDDNTPSVASWDVRPAATGSTSWSFDKPGGGWVVRRTGPALKSGIVYNLAAGAGDESGDSGYVLFTVEDLRAMKPGEVRIYDDTRQPPADEPTGSLEQQARDENEGMMRVVTQSEFEQMPCR